MFILLIAKVLKAKIRAILEVQIQMRRLAEIVGYSPTKYKLDMHQASTNSSNLMSEQRVGWMHLVATTN